MLVLLLLPDSRQNQFWAQSCLCLESWSREVMPGLREKPGRAAQKEISGLGSGDNGEGFSLGVELGRAVLIANPQGQGQIGSYPPLVLREPVGCLAANAVARVWSLKQVVRCSHQKVGEAVASAIPACCISEITEVAVGKEGIDSILLIGGKSCTEFPRVASFYPRERVRKRIGVAGFVGGTGLVRSNARPLSNVMSGGPLERSDAIPNWDSAGMLVEGLFVTVLWRCAVARSSFSRVGEMVRV